LRTYDPDDWERVHVYASVPEFSQYDIWGPNSVDDSKAFVASCIEETEREPILRYELAIVSIEQNLLIGGCSLKRKHASDGAASLGFAVNPDFHNQGYATEVVGALCDFGFSVLGLSKILAACDARNTASYRVMEEVGMTRVATKRSDSGISGAMMNSYHYELCKASGKGGGIH
jgi:RimJ/RimL family protein N-acetyltransferase